MPIGSSCGPGADSTDAVDRDTHDLSGRRIVHGRELHVGAEVHVGEPLEQISRAAFFESRPTVDDEVLLQPRWMYLCALDRERNPRIAREFSSLR